MGNHVVVVDVDPSRVERLNQGETIIYEPGLNDLHKENLKSGRLTFTTDAVASVEKADAAFICVGTPMADNGAANLKYVQTVAETIGQHMTKSLVVVTKSTVPVGTGDKVRAWVESGQKQAGKSIEFSVASNPEFLKEGAAVDDFMRPDRVVIGVEDERAGSTLRHIYGAFMRNGLRLYEMDIRSAEMTKYTANCMLATKISFINEIANLCEHLGADVEQVRQGVGSDSRIGMKFLHPGVGYGGSCFPKDVRALIRTALDAGGDPHLLQAVQDINQGQKHRMFGKLQTWAELTDRSLSDVTVAVWGLAFKPNTDDIREAPSLELIRALLAAGAKVRAHDPHATPNTAAELGDHEHLSFFEDAYEAAQADCLVLMTEWRPYRRPDWQRIADSLAGKAVFDGRNQYDAERLQRFGLTTYGIGTSKHILPAS
jgi:UDPglucose 6-dehydrogenase